jgi:hypothetical protein
LVDGAAAIVKLLADFDKVGDGLGVFKSWDQISFQGAGDSVTKGGELSGFIPRNFGGVPGEFSVVRGEVAVALLDGVELSLGILDTVGISECVFKDLD